VLRNPGAPIVTSHDGGQDGVVWVLDQNARRTDPVVPKPGFVPAGAVLYAFDAATLETLWASAPGDLGPGGKYGHVVVAHGTVYVATDRVAAFVGKGAP
jgi:outer membrane protein assembly factor BamB